MRSLLCLLSLLVGLIYLGDIAAKAERGNTPHQAGRLDPFGSQGDMESDDLWRRTTSGWEKTSTWPKPTPTPIVQDVHPFMLATLMVLMSLAALVAFAHPDEFESRTLLGNPFRKNGNPVYENGA